MTTRIKNLLVILTCFVSLWACQPDDEPIPAPAPPGGDKPTTEEPAGLITEKGQPEGTTASAAIGPDGGTLTSADGRVSLVIPAGAVTATTTFTIQPISNKMPNGIRTAYRFTPNEQQLAKPATLTFTFTEADINGSAPEALGIAYQNAKGAWESAKDKQVNPTNKTVSKAVKNLKDHSLFTEYVLVPGNAKLEPNETVELQVKRVIFRLPTKEGYEDLLVDGYDLAPAQIIKSWTLNGQNSPAAGAAGSLSGSGATRTYKAPAKAPALNPVRVGAEIDGPQGSKVILFSYITIAAAGQWWEMNIEWLRKSICGPGAIAKSNLTSSAKIFFKLDANQKIIEAEITNADDAIVSGVVSCNEDAYAATATAEGINITAIEGAVDPKTGILHFTLKGKWMDLPTYTLYYKNGPTVVTDESYQDFSNEYLKAFLKMPLKADEVLNLRSSNAAGDAGFIFTLIPVE